MAYELIWESQGVIFKYTGSVSDMDCLESNREFYAHSHSERTLYQIIDFSDVETFNFDAITTNTVASMDVAESRIIPNIYVAFVSKCPCGEQIANGYSLKLEQLNTSWNTSCFLDISSARNWIQEGIL